MKRIIYVLLMMLPVMASAQKSEDSIRQELRNAIVKTFKDVAKKTGGEYRINGRVEKYSVDLAMFKNGNIYGRKEDENHALKDQENITYALNEFNRIYDVYYKNVPKSYGVFVRQKDGTGLDTIRVALGITPRSTYFALSDVQRTFREYFTLDFNKTEEKSPFMFCLSATYKARMDDDVLECYATPDDIAELKSMLVDYLRTLKGYKQKSYNVSYEYNRDFKPEKDELPMLYYGRIGSAGVKTTGKHYVIRMPKEDMQSNSSVFINKMIEKAKVLGAMSLTTEIDPTQKFKEYVQFQDLMVACTCVLNKKTQQYSFYNIVFGFDEKGFHVLETESIANPANWQNISVEKVRSIDQNVRFSDLIPNPIPMMWMNIKTLYNDKVKWEKGLEP